VDREGEHPSSHLKGYKGVIHADGFTGFNGLFVSDRHHADCRWVLLYIERWLKVPVMMMDGTP
jgi:hypothetical protein